MTAPTYLQRLRLEGAVLAGCGTFGTVLLLAVTARARHAPVSTAAQLLVVAALLAWLGPRGLRRSIASSGQLSAQDVGSGEPTPLWHIVAIAVVLTVLAGELGGWGAGLRVTAGCLLVGAFQSIVLGRAVASRQRASRRTYYRIPGSRILKGTRLGHVTRESAAGHPARDGLRGSASVRFTVADIWKGVVVTVAIGRARERIRRRLGCVAAIVIAATALGVRSAQAALPATRGVTAATSVVLGNGSAATRPPDFGLRGQVLYGPTCRSNGPVIPASVPSRRRSSSPAPSHGESSPASTPRPVDA